MIGRSCILITSGRKRVNFHFPSCSDSESDCSCPQEPPKPPSEYKILDEVKEDSPEILFYKTARVPGSELYYFTSFLKDKQRIIGFDPEGKQINTTEVQPDKRESWFSIV